MLPQTIGKEEKKNNCETQIEINGKVLQKRRDSIVVSCINAPKTKLFVQSACVFIMTWTRQRQRQNSERTLAVRSKNKNFPGPFYHPKKQKKSSKIPPNKIITNGGERRQ